MAHKLCLILSLCFSSFPALANVVARIPIDKESAFCRGSARWEDQGEYHIELLKLALAESGVDVRIEPVCMFYPSEKRRVPLLLDGTEINVIFFGTTHQREKLLKAVYVPLFLGTTGLRMFLVRKETLAVLSKFSRLGDFQSMTFGQGLGWPDGEILRQNGFSVVGAPYETLHKMLSLGRFDIYPRSYWQIASEFEWMSKDANNIAIIPNLAFYYPQPIYFFVSPRHPELHKALTRGLQHSYFNGKMLELLLSHPQTAPSFNRIDLQSLCLMYLPTKHLTTQSLNAMQTFKLPEKYHPRPC